MNIQESDRRLAFAVAGAAVELFIVAVAGITPAALFLCAAGVLIVAGIAIDQLEDEPAQVIELFGDWDADLSNDPAPGATEPDPERPDPEPLQHPARLGPRTHAYLRERDRRRT